MIKKKKPEEIKNEIDSDYNRLILNLGASYKELTLDKLQKHKKELGVHRNDAATCMSSTQNILSRGHKRNISNLAKAQENLTQASHHRSSTTLIK